jgi:hypothetical protein
VLDPVDSEGGIGTEGANDLAGGPVRVLLPHRGDANPRHGAGIQRPAGAAVGRAAPSRRRAQSSHPLLRAGRAEWVLRSGRGDELRDRVMGTLPPQLLNERLRLIA